MIYKGFLLFISLFFSNLGPPTGFLIYIGFRQSSFTPLKHILYKYKQIHAS